MCTILVLLHCRVLTVAMRTHLTYFGKSKHEKHQSYISATTTTTNITVTFGFCLSDIFFADLPDQAEFPKVFKRKTTGDCCVGFFTGRMASLSPNQQCQSTLALAKSNCHITNIRCVANIDAEFLLVTRRRRVETSVDSV